MMHNHAFPTDVLCQPLNSDIPNYSIHNMINKQLEKFSEIVTEAHAKIQRDFQNINPVVSISQKMRSAGIPADALTIDCLKSKKRIIFILHDEYPSITNYQFSFKDKDPSDNYEQLETESLDSDVIYSLMENYFSES